MKAIVTYKTKEQQLVNPASNTSADVYFALKVWHKFAEGYKAEFQYYYLDGEEEVLIKYLGLQKELDNAIVDALAASITATETDYVARENEFLAAGSLAIIGEDNHFGLIATDWEIVVNE
jgi:hypothetical protein